MITQRMKAKKSRRIMARTGISEERERKGEKKTVKLNLFSNRLNFLPPDASFASSISFPFFVLT